MSQAGNTKVARVLHIKFSMPGASAAQLHAMLSTATPYLKLLGGTSVRLLQNVDDPSRYIQEIEYQSDETIEVNRQRIASEPRLQQYLAAWRAMGAGEINVYRDVAAG